ncbi:MAG: hypothetical protein D3926_23895 [Desulfobacteraceae bacterium]|nr:MAG: hypothetical protein D3926_23895 [Desulfobacteraceae bacterium]
MGRAQFWTIVRIGVIMGVVLLVTAAACYAGGAGEGKSSKRKSTAAPSGATKTAPLPWYDDDEIDPGFGAPGFVYPKEDKTNTIANTWGAHKKDKPAHWTGSKWRSYQKKRQSIYRYEAKENIKAGNRADRNYKIAKGVGVAAAAGGAVVGAAASPAAAPAIYIIGVGGDGAAATAGSLAEGKSLKEAAKDGAKKSLSSALLGKVGSGKTNAALGFAGGQAVDDSMGSGIDSSLVNQMPEPDGYGIGMQPHWK